MLWPLLHDSNKFLEINGDKAIYRNKPSVFKISRPLTSQLFQCSHLFVLVDKMLRELLKIFSQNEWRERISGTTVGNLSLLLSCFVGCLALTMRMTPLRWKSNGSNAYKCLIYYKHDMCSTDGRHRHECFSMTATKWRLCSKF